MRNCPECGEQIGERAVRCACGWSKKVDEKAWPYDRCKVEHEGRRCFFPARIFRGNWQRGGGECRLHDGAWGPAVAEIIAESERWYDARKRGIDVPLTYVRFDGQTVPGFPSGDQIDRLHKRRAAETCARMGLVNVAQQRAAVKAMVSGGIFKRQREPGEDD